jgi:osmotically-inducible protein OsmY
MISTATDLQQLQSDQTGEGDSDQVLQIKVNHLLASSPYALLRKLQCEVNEGMVTLYGSVPSFFLKQMAQEAILRLGEVRRVKNQVEVGRAAHVQEVRSAADLYQMAASSVEAGSGSAS